MPLIPCPDCGTEVSDQAKACPKCGRPVRKPLPEPIKEPPWVMWVAIAGVVVVLIVTGALKGMSRPTPPPSKPGSDAARQAVLAEVKSGSTTKSAMWSQDMSLWISVIDDGTRRDGYAQYACEVVRQKGIRDYVVVHVWDAFAMMRNEFKELGKARCR